MCTVHNVETDVCSFVQNTRFYILFENVECKKQGVFC